MSTNIKNELPPTPQESNAQILNDIQSLQDIEKQLFTSLEENTSLSTNDQMKIIDKINNISKMRVNLYETLNGVNHFYQDALKQSKTTLKEQATAIDIVEKELNSAKRRLKLLEEERNNKIRMLEINNYYGERYAEHASLMKIIILMLVPVVFLTFLYQRGLIPFQVYFILIVIVGVIGGVHILKTVRSIMLRDAMNYDEYEFPFDVTSAPKITGDNNANDPWSKPSSATTEFVFDSASNMCLAPANINLNKEPLEKKTMETFVNEVFTKSTEYQKPDVTLGTENVQPHIGSSMLYK